MKKILIDCDNTIGIEGRPMDDALAILYLLGRSDDVQVMGICCNYGNGSSAEVYACTKRFLSEIGRTDIPLLLGAEQDTDNSSVAATFIAELVRNNPDEIIYLGLGSLGNLYGAYLEDNSTLKKLKQIVLMGGITEPLYVHNQALAELNFSINHLASYAVLSEGHNISIITGNNCLPVSALPKDEFLDNLCRSDNRNASSTGMYIAQKCGYRFVDKKAIYDAEASYCWDGIAAVYITNPELFVEKEVGCYINEFDLRSGFLNPVVAEKSNQRFNLPEARSRKEIQEKLYEAWLSLDISTKSAEFSCSGLYLDKLIQPCILIELSKEPCHGFLLLQRLKEKGCVDESLDPTGFYRNLKRMENDGYLKSQACGNGPKGKKMYSITDIGKRALLNWKDSLKRYSDYINSIIDRIE